MTLQQLLTMVDKQRTSDEPSNVLLEEACLAGKTGKRSAVAKLRSTRVDVSTLMTPWMIKSGEKPFF